MKNKYLLLLIILKCFVNVYSQTAPIIIAQPIQQQVCPFSSAAFTVNASGSGTLTYQWMRFNSLLETESSIPNSNSNVLTFPEVDYSYRNSKIRVIVSNQYGSVTSEYVFLKIYEPSPAIYHESYVANNGDKVKIVPSFIDYKPPLYTEWEFKGIKTIGGQTFTTPTLSNADGLLQKVSLILHDSCNQPSSDFSMDINIRQKPVITVQPSNYLATTKSPYIIFQVDASGYTDENGSELKYQWYKTLNNTRVPLTDAKDPFYQIYWDEAMENLNAQYDVVIINSLGTVTSNKVKFIPSIPVNPNWIASDANIFYDYFRVGIGIGVQDPTTLLDVRGSSFAKTLAINGEPTSGHMDYTLSVKGKIVTKDLVITAKTTTWPDYVFKDSYKLKSPHELSNYIHNNRKLPGIPSEKEVKETGVNQGEFSTTLLEKVEELTLHTIRLKEKNNVLNHRLNKLELRK